MLVLTQCLTIHVFLIQSLIDVLMVMYITLFKATPRYVCCFIVSATLRSLADE
jgi:ABC-type arginine/histidine transport system permease subunit